MVIKNVLIIEDEKPNAERLKRLLKKVRPHVHIAGTEETVLGSVEWLLQNPHPDVILLDIRLADGLSFEIFKEVEVKSSIIFTTAYDEYAVRAFKFNSIDYLLKPIEEEELITALEKCEMLLEGRQENHEKLYGLLDFLQTKDHRKRFLLPYRDGYKTLLVTEIGYFSSELGIVRAHLHNGESEIVPQTLEELEKQLDPELFFRANRQFILHIDSIAKVSNYFSGKLKLELRKNSQLEIIVSREKAPLLKSWMDF